MKKKTKGGISYNFDIATIGRISVEREYNRNLYLDEEGAKLITELNAFAHSFDFQSKESVFRNTNAYRFLLTNKPDKFDYTDYFIKNLKKANKDGKLLSSLKNIIMRFKMDEPEINEYDDKDDDEDDDEVSVPMFTELIETIKELYNLILYDDFSHIEREEEIKSDSEVETLKFLEQTKLLYGSNYKQIMIIGGTGSEDEEKEEDYPLLQRVPFVKYYDIKQKYHELGGDIFDYLTIIIGYSNMFRLCGLFRTNSKAYRFLNTLYHLLSNYPLHDYPVKKNKYLLEIYKKTYYTVIKIIEKIYQELSGVKLSKSLINKIQNGYVAAEAPVAEAPVADVPVAEAPVAKGYVQGSRRSLRIANRSGK